MADITRRIQSEARRLLESGEVEAVIGFEKGSLPLRARPTFIRRPEDVETLVWNGFCENNLARYLLKVRDQRVGIVAKGCDTRAIVALMAERQVDRDRIFIIGVPCNGMVDSRQVAKAVPGEITEVEVKGQRIFARGKDFEMILPRRKYLHSSCQACEYPNPVIYDVLVAKSVESKGDLSILTDQFESLSHEERWTYFASESERCIRCYACREACPMCYCNECFVDHTMPRWSETGVTPSGLQFWHIVRAYHQTGRCVTCGACERACPMGIKLVYLMARLNEDVRELFEFETGLNPEAVPPLATFQSDKEREIATQIEAGAPKT